MFCIFLVGNQDEQANGLISKSDIIGFESLNEENLPSIQALFVELHKLVQAANAKVLHVVVSVVEELIDSLDRLLDKIC